MSRIRRWMLNAGIMGGLLLCGVDKGKAFGAVTFSASSGARAASATFDVVGGNLVVTLANTSTFDVLSPAGTPATNAGILTAVFFDVTGQSTALTSLSAVVGAGSAIVFDTAPPPLFFGPGTVVGGEHAYAYNASGLGGAVAPFVTQTNGISSAGFGIFGSATFPGANLDPPLALDGLNYGLTSAGDNLATGNAAVTGGNPLIQNSVVFTLGAWSSVLSAINNIRFQYGTALNEGTIDIPPPPPVSEPSTLALAGIGALSCLGFGIFRRRRNAA